MRLDTIGLSVRSINCLTAQGYEYVGQVVDKGPADLLGIPHFGRTSLVDVEGALRRLGLDLGTDVGTWSVGDAKLRAAESAKALAQARRSAIHNHPVPLTRRLSVRVDSMNLSRRARNTLVALRCSFAGDVIHVGKYPLLRRANFGNKSLAEIEDALLKIGLDFDVELQGWLPSVARARERVHAADVMMTSGSSDTERSNLVDSLWAAVASIEASERNRELILKHLGWNAYGPITLEAAGQQVGLTRERVRQLVERATERLKQQRTPIPLTIALKAMRSAGPVTLQQFRLILQEAGVGSEIHPAGLRNALRTYGLPTPYEVTELGGDAFLLPFGGSDAIERVLSIAKKLISSKGCANVDEVRQQLLSQFRWLTYEFVSVLVDVDPELEWLDRENDWFWRIAPPGNRNRLVNNIRKVLAATPSLKLAELRAAIRRDVRVQGFAPPTDVLRRLCGSLPFCEVIDEVVSRIESQENWETVLGPANNTVVRVLREHGPVLHRLDFLRECLAAGMNENTVGVFSTYSVLLWRPAPGFYCLAGTHIPPGTIEAIRSERQIVVPAHVESGWTTGASPMVFGVWRIPFSILTGGIVSVPSSVHEFVQGDWQLKSPGGHDLGNIEVRDATCWNLRRALKVLGAETDDYLTLWFDRRSRTAFARISGDDAAETAPGGPPAPDSSASTEDEDTATG